MKLEIESVANFLTHLINLAEKDKFEIDAFKLHNFNINLQDILTKKYSDAWSYGNPWVGSDFRALRINENLDPRIVEASLVSDIPIEEIQSRLPSDLIIWIDPGLVKCRIVDFYWFDLYDIATDSKPWTSTPVTLKKQYKGNFDEVFRKSCCNCDDDDNNCIHDCI